MIGWRNRMKKLPWILIIILILIIVGFLIFRKGGGKEEITVQALALYEQKKAEGMQFSSQCLGTVGNEVKYVVDIVHVPRSSEDNLPENQCGDYRSGEVNHFIELDKDGNVVRIV